MSDMLISIETKYKPVLPSEMRDLPYAAQVRSIGKRDCGNLFKLGDEMIQFAGLHALLAASVADMLPVSLAALLSEDAKRQARSAAAKHDHHGAIEAAAAKSFEGLMNSPWKVRAARTRLGRPLVGHAACSCAQLAGRSSDRKAE